MGQVYRAHDSATDRIVALKVLPAPLADDPDYQQRFRREVHSAAGLDDPHVVPIHNFGEIEGQLYVDMRLIEGSDLGTLIAAGGRLHPARAVAIIGQVASALDSAHRAGLVHRDVKPSNILVTAGDFTYLTDFGVAPTATGTAQTDTRSDIYSLACVLYECLTGQRPDPGDSPQPSTIRPDLPQAVDAVIARGMAEDPDERYQTATELAYAAHAALTGPPAAPPGSWPPPPTQYTPWQPGPPVMMAGAPPRLAPPSMGLRVTRYLLALLSVLIGAYLVIVFVGGHSQPAHSIEKEGGTRIRLTAQKPPDGSTPNHDTLLKAQQVIAARVNGLGISGARVVVDGDSVVVTVPGNNGDEIRNIGSTGRLYVRPVLNSIPAQPASGEPAPGLEPSDPGKDLAERIADEKKWRQSTRQGIQYLALQFQATQCNKDDILASNDDPTLPLVTCSTDHKAAYLLGPSIISGDQIEKATSGMNQQGMGYVVDVQFKPAAASAWADFTAAHIGTQTAFTLDSEVVSAPVIQEAIPGGRTQITGGDPPFTEMTAHQLANVLVYHPLPLNFVGSPPETIPPQPHSNEPDLLSPPAWAVAAVICVLLIVLCALLCLSVPSIRTRLSR
jgi:preprotein translocase subunit SecD